MPSVIMTLYKTACWGIKHAAYLSQHEVAIFVRAELNTKHSADVIWDDESGLFVL